ncbi:uncharacterized protein LOC133832294 [Humulus lupulus]|uniref:uncharacterized protein LOC133832294 n=1 Tax=Humulus lupulus TaxID=3486 RepID=UPI002B416CA7|nr:uncharacterized protein LOC133832294 [Humulus lupulus]
MELRTKVIKRVVQQGVILSSEQANSLLLPYSKEEVQKAIWEILGSKAPGPDGKILKELNSTILTLILKGGCPKYVSDFRPIACCNVLYKVATKMICSRLSSILPVIIAQNQGGFVKGRSIAHYIMICQDLDCHYGRKNGKPKCMKKLDLRKAYDTIE